MDIMETLREQVDSNPILLYMKGSPQMPQCGFSSQTVQALMACGQKFAYVDVLSHPEVRQNLPKFADWPTFPQLWVEGELVGGCDIVVEMSQSGELKTLIDEAAGPRCARRNRRRHRRRSSGAFQFAGCGLHVVGLTKAVEKAHLRLKPVEMLFFGFKDAFEQIAAHVVPDGFAMGDAVAEIGNGLVLDAEIRLENLADCLSDAQTPKVLEIGQSF